MKIKKLGQGKLEFLSCEEDAISERDKLYTEFLSPYVEELDKLADGKKHKVNSLERRNFLFKALDMKVAKVPLDPTKEGEYVDKAIKGKNTDFYFETIKKLWINKHFHPFATSDSKPKTKDTFIVRMSTTSPGAYAITFWDKCGEVRHQRYQSVIKDSIIRFYYSDNSSKLDMDDPCKSIIEVIHSFEMTYFNRTKKMIGPDVYIS